MHLTLESLHQVKKTCAEIKSLEGLMSAEDRMQISEQVITLSNAVTSTITTIESLNQMRSSLEACGYSDEWFDNVCGMGFKDLVTIDMPKFFDNKVNRQDVCMEGFTDTIKAWLIKAWELLKKFLGWIRDMSAKLVSWLNIKNVENTNKITWAFGKIDRCIDLYLKEKQGIDLNGWYEIEGLTTQLPSVKGLIEIVTDKFFIANSLNASQPDTNVNEDMKRDFYERTRQALLSKGIATDKPEVTGFALKLDQNSNNVVQFLGVQIHKDFPKTKLQIRSRDSMMQLKDLFVAKIVPMMNDTANYLKASDIIVKKMIMDTEREISTLKTAAVVDNAKINFQRKIVIQANLASNVASSALMFLNKFIPMIIVDRDLIVKVAEVIDK